MNCRFPIGHFPVSLTCLMKKYELVARAKPVLLFAQTTKRRWLSVVQLVFDRLECFQISEDRFEIIFRHLAVENPGHLGMQTPRAHFSITHGLHEGALAVVDDSRGRRRNIR